MKYSVQCPQCGNMVDSKEPCCPNCGNQVKKKNTSAKVFIIIFGIFFIFPFIFIGLVFSIISHSFSEAEEFIDKIDVEEFEKFGTTEETISQLTYTIPNTLTTISKTSSQYSNYENIYKYTESSGNCTINIISNINGLDQDSIKYTDNASIINDLELNEALPKISRVDNVLINDYFWGYALFENETESHKYYVTTKNISYYMIKYTKSGTSDVCDDAFSTISESLNFQDN